MPPGFQATRSLLLHALSQGELCGQIAERENSDLGTDVELAFDELEVNIKAVFNRPNYASNATDRTLSIHQGARRVAEYTVEFWKLAVEAGWNESPLQGFFFCRGLSGPLRDALALT